MSKPVPRRPMTELERDRALALGLCCFPPASFSKRFARELRERVNWALLAKAAVEISEKEAGCLERLCWTYRRQLPARLRSAGVQLALPLTAASKPVALPAAPIPEEAMLI